MDPIRLRLALGLAVIAALALLLRESRLAPHNPGATALAGNSRVNAAAVDPGAKITDPVVCAPADALPTQSFESRVAALHQRTDALAKTAAFTDWLTQWRRAD